MLGGGGLGEFDWDFGSTCQCLLHVLKGLRAEHNLPDMTCHRENFHQDQHRLDSLERTLLKTTRTFEDAQRQDVDSVIAQLDAGGLGAALEVDHAAINDVEYDRMTADLIAGRVPRAVGVGINVGPAVKRKGKRKREEEEQIEEEDEEIVVSKKVKWMVGVGVAALSVPVYHLVRALGMEM